MHEQITSDLDFIAGCLKRLALRKRGNVSVRLMANISTDTRTHLDYFHDIGTPLEFDLRLEVSDEVLLDHVKDKLCQVGRVMMDIVEATEGTDMVLLAYLNTDNVSHFKYLYTESWQNIWCSPILRTNYSTMIDGQEGE